MSQATARQPVNGTRTKPGRHHGVNVFEFDADAHQAPHVEPPMPAANSDMAARNGHDLFLAVKTRLRGIVGDGATKHDPQQAKAIALIHAKVLECAATLDQLDTTLLQERGRREQLEIEIFDVQTALAQARAELAGTQKGEQRARHLARHDSLTELPNRTFFHERLHAALGDATARREALAVLYLDLDGFKLINDTHGHDAGDELLRIVSARLKRVVRAADMVGRVGGDEFALLLSNVASRAQLSHLANKVFDAVSAPLKIGMARLSVRPSIGIAIGPTDGGTTEALLKSADAAMVRAKRQQAGYLFFDEPADCVNRF